MSPDHHAHTVPAPDGPLTNTTYCTRYLLAVYNHHHQILCNRGADLFASAAVGVDGGDWKSYSAEKQSSGSDTKPLLISTQSVMRRAIAHALDRMESKTRKDKIVNRRGAFKCLPVLFSNDLIHGSWWYAVGSVFVVIIASIMSFNSYHPGILGSDDSILSPFHYRASWGLTLLSGIFFTLGSMAFVR